MQNVNNYIHKKDLYFSSLSNILSKTINFISYSIKFIWKLSVILFSSIFALVLYINEINVIIDQMFRSFFISSSYVFSKFIEFICMAITKATLWLIALICRWKREKFTFVIIAPETSRQKNICISKLSIYSGTLVVSLTTLFLVISSFVLFNINEKLTNEVYSSREKTVNLLAINESYEEEMDSLKNNAVIVSEKLSELNDLEYKIRDMVGLEIPEETNTKESISKPLTRSSDRTVNLPQNDILYVPEDDNEIIDLIENEKEVIDKFSKDLESRLDFLDSRPDKMPANGTITSPFGFRIHPTSGKKDFHKGIDIANDQGSPIFVAGSGVVTYVGYNGGYGNMVIVSHGYGYKSVYAHLKSSSVKLGESVKKGDLIARMGSTGLSTGSHLHFEIHYNGKQINPLNVIE